jgi:hypothetical protein
VPRFSARAWGSLGNQRLRSAVSHISRIAFKGAVCSGIRCRALNDTTVSNSPRKASLRMPLSNFAQAGIDDVLSPHGGEAHSAAFFLMQKCVCLLGVSEFQSFNLEFVG